jgi:hypothetical protein
MKLKNYRRISNLIQWISQKVGYSFTSIDSLASFYADSLNRKFKDITENQKLRKKKIKIGKSFLL